MIAHLNLVDGADIPRFRALAAGRGRRAGMGFGLAGDRRVAARGTGDRAVKPAEYIVFAQPIVAGTRAEASLMHAEHEHGVLAPGILADLVVLGRDPFAVDASAIHAIPVDMTLVAGQPAFSRLRD